MIGIGIVLAIIVYASIAQYLTNKAQAAHTQAVLLQRQEDWDRNQSRLALTCRRCEALSPPIPKTQNRYRCEKCGHQFAAARHGQKDRPTEANPYPR